MKIRYNSEYKEFIAILTEHTACNMKKKKNYKKEIRKSYHFSSALY